MTLILTHERDADVEEVQKTVYQYAGFTCKGEIEANILINCMFSELPQYLHPFDVYMSTRVTGCSACCYYWEYSMQPTKTE